MAIRSSPIALTLEQKVDYAHRYWTARNPGQQDVYQATLPNYLRKNNIPKTEPIPTEPPKAKKEKISIDELSERFARMEAHIANQ